MIMDYKKAGVDIEAAQRSLEGIKGVVGSTWSPGVISNLSHFAGLYRLKGERYKDPVLVSSTDGVGTKLKIAFMVGRHSTVGQDLVHHCANDILVHGARPLLFMDYFAMSEISSEVIEEVISGLAKGCKEVGCSLIGGETAQMPEFYRSGEYDLAGFILGLVERDEIVDGSRIEAGDQIVGLASNGLHTNGFSLARKILLRKWRVDDYLEDLGSTLGEELLRVHHHYGQAILSLLSQGFKLKGMAHITGGGIEGNLSRIIPSGLVAQIKKGSWEVPPVFGLIEGVGEVEEEEMFTVFNMGIGFILVVSPSILGSVLSQLRSQAEIAWPIGEVVKGNMKKVIFE